MKLPLSIVALGLLFNVATAQVDVDINLIEFATGLLNPVDITNAGDDRLFACEQNGRIRVIQSDGTVLATPFLNMTSLTDGGGEQGLLGLAFHPNYTENGYFYVNYTMVNGDTRISRFSVNEDDPNVAVFGSRMDLMTIDQPYSNHNGGCLRFGPDGYLYIGMGDGGAGEDPDDYGQSMDELLGKMLRIDVDGAMPYEVPASNPFVGTSADTLPEIWASGIRNPWKFSFDRETGDLWIGDVGQYSWEEIDFQSVNSPGGENYGWRCYEGNHVGFGSGCAPMSSYVGAITEYSHASSACSVTGGHVYRGAAYPALNGKYLYVDYCNGQFRSVELNDADEWISFLISGQEGFGWTGFGEDYLGEMYVANANSDKIFKIIDESCADNAAIITNNGDGTLSASIGLNYQWYLNGEAIPLATGQDYVMEQDGLYSVLVEFFEGCNDFSESISVITSSLVDLSQSHGLRIQSNPISNELTLIMSRALEANAQLNVYNALGAEVFNEVLSAGSLNHTVDLSTIAEGHYTLHIQSAEGKSVMRFVKTK